MTSSDNSAIISEKTYANDCTIAHMQNGLRNNHAASNSKQKRPGLDKGNMLGFTITNHKNDVSGNVGETYVVAAPPPLRKELVSIYNVAESAGQSVAVVTHEEDSPVMFR